MASLSISAYAADAGHTARDVDLVHAAGADSIHVDVMDGHFVTLTGLGDNWLESMRPRITLPLDVLFMTYAPERFAARFERYKPATVVFHAESSSPDAVRGLLGQLRGHGIRGGLALSPDADPASLVPYLSAVDEILVMTTPPGRPGSVFLPEARNHIRAVRRLLADAYPAVTLSVDGGLDDRLAFACIEDGAGKVVMGRSYFHHPDPKGLADRIHSSRPGRSRSESSRDRAVADG
ncbi:MAG: hypothetical protein LIQ30_07445 [Planctomycetes bacterium]|nr:hypothetical protein [Planctomycetota bacterium]